MTEMPLTYGALLSTVRSKCSLTLKVKFRLYNPPIHLPSTDIVAPTGLLSWMACCLRTEKMGAVDLGELKHIKILF